MPFDRNIQIVSAPSILGLKPGGVERLPESLLSAGLLVLAGDIPVIKVHPDNASYSDDRDHDTGCLNPSAIRKFSTRLSDEVLAQLEKTKTFTIVLGGDCSILLGIMSALKARGTYGLVFLDAHADFYEPSKSVTGEVADMDLAIITGRGPDILSDIDHRRPYVKDEHVVHIGQRDGEETEKYGSQDIRDSAIKRFDLKTIRNMGMDRVVGEVSHYLEELPIEGFWIHFDTDVLSDEENPAVDYRLPGGLTSDEIGFLLKAMVSTGKSVGMSVTIYNPDLDSNDVVAKRIVHCIIDAVSPLRCSNSL